MFFWFPPDGRWNPDRNCVEFSVSIGAYEGLVRVGRRVFQALLAEAPTPERCVEGYYLHRTRPELIAERKLRCRQLAKEGDVEITGRDLRERKPSAPTGPGRLSPIALRGQGSTLYTTQSGGSPSDHDLHSPKTGERLDQMPLGWMQIAVLVY